MSEAHSVSLFKGQILIEVCTINCRVNLCLLQGGVGQITLLKQKEKKLHFQHFVWAACGFFHIMRHLLWHGFSVNTISFWPKNLKPSPALTDCTSLCCCGCKMTADWQHQILYFKFSGESFTWWSPITAKKKKWARPAALGQRTLHCVALKRDTGLQSSFKTLTVV